MDNAIPPVATPARADPDDVDWTGQMLGEFRILHRIGRGGMGQVYLAEQTSLKRKVALKILDPDLASSDRSLTRFKTEAENVARATHANIVQIYTIGQANGVNYIALEYVEGKNLGEFIEKKGTPELSLGLHIMTQVASALQRAGELNIIHRDIKPENIMLTKKGEVKVADFGLSRCFAEDAASPSVTQSQVSMGTPLYMSPEQVERRTVDTRTDIYSFGVTCYHMFAGTPPFKGSSPIDVAYQHVHNEPPPLDEIRPDLPGDLCAIVKKMMAKKPEERYQTAREILRDITHLREALNLGSVGAISISSSFIGIASDSLRNASTQPWIEPGKSNAGAFYLMLGLVLAALASGLAFGWYQNVRPNGTKQGQQGQVNPPPVDPVKDRKPVSAREREKELQQRVQEYLKPDDQLAMNAGLQACVDLGLFYLKQRRLDEADAFFLDIGKREVRAYRLAGRLGHAITLAFKDNAAASNLEFVAIIATFEKLEAKFPLAKALKKNPELREELEAYRLLWKDNASMRETVAKALNYNRANDAKAFPASLDAYRFPPKAKVAPA